MILKESRIKNLLKNVIKSPDGKNLYATCPKCGHDEFGISIKEDYHPFGCFRKKKCGFSGNIFDLISFLGIKKEDFFEGRFDASGGLEVIDFDKVEEKKIELPEPIKPPMLWKRVSSDPYLEQRRIQPYQFKKYKLGRSTIKRGYVTILIELDGEIRGYITRSERSKEWHDKHKKALRYDNSKGTDFSALLAGYDELSDQTHTVILVEGFFDKTATEYLLGLDYGPEIKCCCTFGGHVTSDQIRLLKNKGVKNIILLFESDIINELIKVSSAIGSKFESVKVGWLPEGKDPNQLTQEELMSILERLEDFVEFQLKHYETIN